MSKREKMKKFWYERPEGYAVQFGSCLLSVVLFTSAAGVEGFIIGYAIGLFMLLTGVPGRWIWGDESGGTGTNRY